MSGVQKWKEKYAGQSGVNMSGLQIQNLQSPIYFFQKSLVIHSFTVTKCSRKSGSFIFSFFHFIKTKNNKSTDYNNINNKHRKEETPTFHLDLKQASSALRKNIGILGYRGSPEFEEREFCF